MEILAQSFSPDKLHRTMHEVARLTLAGQSASARNVLQDALCDVEAWLLQATDVESAYHIVEARAAVRLANERLRAEPFTDVAPLARFLCDPPTEPAPEPAPLPDLPDCYPVREVAA